MTVNELLELLKSHPPDLRVMVSGYEDGYDDLESDYFREANVRLNVNTKWYVGRHDEADASNRDKGEGCTRALILHRPWHDYE